MLRAAQGVLAGQLGFVRQAYAQSLAALNPVAYWHLGEANGPTILDERAIQNGTFAGLPQFGLPPLVMHSLGTSVGFDGTSAYGVIEHNSAFALASYTIDFAFQCDVAPAVGQNAVLLSKDVISPAPAGALSIDVFNIAGQLKLRAYAGGAPGSPVWIGGLDGAVDLEVGVAYKVALTIDPLTGAKLYLDGAEVELDDAEAAVAAAGIIGWTTNFAPIVIGAYSVEALGKFDGILDEVALFGRALSAAEITELATPRNVAWAVPVAAGSVSPQGTQAISLKASGWHGREPITATVVSQPSLGVATSNGEGIDYIAGLVEGADSFQFRFTDANGTQSNIQTCTLAVAAAQAFMIPRTDLWLTNDDQDPAAITNGTIRYASPTGSGVGGSSEGTAGNLQATLAACGPGDTVVCLQGYYSAPSGLNIPAGASESSPTTVMAKPGAWVVICRDIDALKVPGVDAGAGRPTEVAWTLWDAAHNVWRIPYTGASSTVGSQGNVVGCWFEGGMAHLLLPYDVPAEMMVGAGGDKGGDNRDSVNTPQDRHSYWGPGVAVGNSSGGAGTGFLYIRFDRPNWTDVGNLHATYGAWPDDDRYHLGIEGQTVAPKWLSRSNASDFRTGRPCLPNPLNETPNSAGNFPSGQAVARNPNNARIYFANTNDDNPFINTSSGSFIRIGSGVNSHGYRRWIRGKSNIEVHRGCDWIPSIVFVGAVANVTVHRRRQFAGAWRFLTSMQAFKFNFAKDIWEGTKHGHSEYLAIGTSASPSNFSNITIENCLIAGYHECWQGNAPVNKVRMVHCAIHEIFDEFMQVRPTISQIEVGWCYFRDTPWGEGTNDSSGTQSPFATHWFHHNIIDNRKCRASNDGARPINGGAVDIGRQNSANSASKIYNVTSIYSPDTSSGTGLCIGSQCCAERTNAASAAEFDEVFNSIFVTMDTCRHATHEGGVNAAAFSDQVEFAARTNGSHDGYRDRCCYSRHNCAKPAGSSSFASGKSHVQNQHIGGPFVSFDYLHHFPSGEPSGSIFVGSTSQGTTPVAPATGARWDQSSTDENPQIPACASNFPANRMDYRPQNLAAVGASAASLSGANWWTSPGWTSYGATAVPFNLAPSPWMGALDPNGSDMPVGIRNP